MDITLNPAARLNDPLSWFLLRPARPAAAAGRPAARPRTPIDSLRHLPHGRTLAIEKPLAQEICCVQGSLWLTHDGDPKDHVITAGQSYIATRHARLLVYALDEARFLVQPMQDARG